MGYVGAEKIASSSWLLALKFRGDLSLGASSKRFFPNTVFG